MASFHRQAQSILEVPDDEKCRHLGSECTIVESAPKLRSGGYLIDFWDAGFDIADRTGLVPERLDKGYVLKELKVVDHNGKRVASFPVKSFNRITHGRYMSIPRSERFASIFGRIQSQAETIFDDRIATIERGENGVRVTFEQAEPHGQGSAPAMVAAYIPAGELHGSSGDFSTTSLYVPKTSMPSMSTLPVG